MSSIFDDIERHAKRYQRSVDKMQTILEDNVEIIDDIEITIDKIRKEI